MAPPPEAAQPAPATQASEVQGTASDAEDPLGESGGADGSPRPPCESSRSGLAGDEDAADHAASDDDEGSLVFVDTDSQSTEPLPVDPLPVEPLPEREIALADPEKFLDEILSTPILSTFFSDSNS